MNTDKWTKISGGWKHKNFNIEIFDATEFIFSMFINGEWWGTFFKSEDMDENAENVNFWVNGN